MIGTQNSAERPNRSKCCNDGDSVASMAGVINQFFRLVLNGHTRVGVQTQQPQLFASSSQLCTALHSVFPIVVSKMSDGVCKSTSARMEEQHPRHQPTLPVNKVKEVEILA